MSTVPPHELLRLWTREEITLEMAIGYLIQNQLKLQMLIEAHHISISEIRADLEQLSNPDASSPHKAKQRSRSKP